nr:uncharacterized protein LOC105845057 isoform X3 [Hydra vulgaris]
MWTWLVHMYCDLTLLYCSLDSERVCLRASDLADYKPFDAVHCLKPTCIYKHIILRHHLYHCNKNDSVLKDVTCLKDTTAIAFSLTETLNSPLDESAVLPTLSSTIQLSPDGLNESRKIKLNVSTTDVQVALRLDNIDFNIRSLLDEHQTGKLVLAEYDSTGALIKRRQDMIHIVVNSMVHRVGNMYPSTKTKSNLAKAIITAFPISPS